MRAKYLLLVVAGLFFVGLVHNVVTGQAGLGDTAAQLIAVSLCLGAFVFAQREARLRDEFLAYLRDHVEVVRAGTGSFRGQPVSYATALRGYTFVLSFLFVTVRLPTRFVLRGEAGELGLRAGCSLVSLVFGWWSIPWGPIWTLQALFKNLRGASLVTVGQLIEGEAAAAPPAATARG